jgi:HlyD family secretion protein
VVTVSNIDLKLKPGMTANVKLLVARRENALLVPNAAFRFRVETSSSASGQRSGGSSSGGGAPTSGGQGRGAGGAGSAPRAGGLTTGAGGGRGTDGVARQGEGSRQRVYVLAEGKPVERQVKIGLSDGQRTEIVEGLAEGDAVIVGTGQLRGNTGAQGGPRLRL